jgi:hypothetical protein
VWSTTSPLSRAADAELLVPEYGIAPRLILPRAAEGNLRVAALPFGQPFLSQ